MAILPAAASLDLSRLPPFKLVDANFEVERATLLERVRQRYALIDLDFDPDQETDPVVILSEEVAMRRTLALQQLNDGANRLTVAYGDGAALDHLGASFYADVGDAVRRQAGETDDRYRWRLMLAAHARVPGSLLGYMFWALAHAPRLTDALALNQASGLVQRGTIAIILLGDPDDDGPDGEAAQIELARAALLDVGHKLGTDSLQIRAAARLDAALDLVLELDGPGPDANLVRLAAQAKVAAYLADRRRIGAPVTQTGLAAAATVGGVLRVRGLPADLTPTPDQVVRITSLTIATEVAGG
ncbi:MAG: baseplate J/gp47 family protein [Phenylobacterium sp.]|nr:baseplate J/gp47 family protein [Phenylobacterium sp.]